MAVNKDKETFNTLRELWSRKKLKQMKANLETTFASGENPYATALRLLIWCTTEETMVPQHSFALTLIKGFSRWIKNQEDKFCKALTLGLKEKAFSVALAIKCFDATRLICKTFKLEESKNELSKVLKNAIRDKEFDKVCYGIGLLEFEREFPVEEFLIPLILFENVGLVLRFVKENRGYRERLARYLDGLLPEDNLSSFVNKFIKQRKIEPPSQGLQLLMSQASIIKLIRLLHLPSYKYTPHLYQIDKKENIRVITDSYDKNELSHIGFMERVTHECQRNKSLKSYFLNLLKDQELFDEYQFWCKKFGFTEDPHLKKPATDDVVMEELPSEKLVDYYSYSHSLQVIEVFFPSLFYNMIKELEGDDLCSLDVKSNSGFGVPSDTSPSVLTIGTRSTVYIVDCSAVKPQMWTEFYTSVLENENMLKIVFDLKLFKSKMSSLVPDFSDKLPNVNDLRQVWNGLRKLNYSFPFEVDKTKGDLSQLVEVCFGQKLDDVEELSNWERNPLRNDQKIYAVTCSTAILEIYMFLKTTTWD